MTAALEVNGTPPDLAGKICQGFICESFTHQGANIAPANVTYLKFDDAWFRLYFEHRLVFWRPYGEEPKPWEVKEEGWKYPHVDVGTSANVVGERLDRYETLLTPDGCKVIFRFASGRTVEIEEKNDVADYAVL